MYRNHTVGVVVPAYNEAGFVGEVIETMPAYVDRIYVIDDCSTDTTWDEIRATAEQVNDADGQGPFDRRVVPIQHDRNRGVGGAIKSGYRRARDDRIDVTAVMGGDGQMRPGSLERYLDPIVEGRAEYTKGNRLLDSDWYDEMPRFRLLGNRILTVLTKIASGYWGIGDPQNGYTAISLTALDTLDIEEMYEFYGYCNDLLVRLNVNGFRVTDVPREPNYADEESHIKYRTYIPRVSAMLLSRFLWRLREQQFHRATQCYAGGMLTGLFGGLLAVAKGRADGLRSTGVRNALGPLLVGCLVFLLGTALDRTRHADRTYTETIRDTERDDSDDSTDPTPVPAESD